MSFTCKDPLGHNDCKIRIQDTRTVYESAKYCKVCEMYVGCENRRCPCCNAPLRTKSKRHQKHRGVF